MTKVTVRNLFRGDVLTSGEIVRNVWSDSKTPKGKRDLVIESKDGKRTKRTWNANTAIAVANR